MVSVSTEVFKRQLIGWLNYRFDDRDHSEIVHESPSETTFFCLVVQMEGTGLWSLLNGYSPDELLLEEFEALCVKHDHWYEIRDTCTVAFYTIDKIPE
jgi:hypothetical protein